MKTHEILPPASNDCSSHYLYLTNRLLFDLFANLISRPVMLLDIVDKAFGIQLRLPLGLQVNYRPDLPGVRETLMPKFHVYLSCEDEKQKRLGIGVNLIYLENSSEDVQPSFMETHASLSELEDEIQEHLEVFRHPFRSWVEIDNRNPFYRQHLLGLKMVAGDRVDSFASVLLHPSQNLFAKDVLNNYRAILNDDYKEQVIACELEEFIEAIPHDDHLAEWKNYLTNHYGAGNFERPLP